uniref:ATPase family AAA domain-containing protein 2 n=1 Tax=Pygocentrus nattereri TaxID=42514 RepID=A0A3B4ENX9_PYGNA
RASKEECVPSQNLIGFSLRLFPVNLRKEDILGVRKDRMKLGRNLADVDPMEIDQSVRFDSVGGLDSHIAALKEMVVFPLVYPEVFDKFKIQPPRGCLFYGPPGTGKTLVARALANECSSGEKKVAFFMRKGADCLSKWVGESERQLRLLFEQAYQMRPSIIFFDEIDGLAPVRSSRQDQIHSSIVSTLLALMDGLDSRGEVVVIGATNRLDSIDPALRRPGRFDREFLFGLPDREARKAILKIHTRQWKPSPSDAFLEELSDKCVGYCGADVKAVCTEAALCALRRRYPQIYGTSSKLLLDVNSISISSRDFVYAMMKMVPASQRAVSSPARALDPVLQPLLSSLLANILTVLHRIYPHAEQGLKRERDSLVGHILDDELMYVDDETPGGILPLSFASVHRNAALQPTSCRPRLLLSGGPGSGQSSHLAPAVLHALEKFTVYTLDLVVLFGVSSTSPEEACAQVFCEAKRTSPSILYLPHIQQWWDTVSGTLKATFLSLLQDISSFSPILLLATSNFSHSELAEELQTLFRVEYGEVFQVRLPNWTERMKFFEDVILHQAAKAPPSKKKSLLQALEVLPLAPPPSRPQMTESELMRLEEQEEDTLRELRLFLRSVTERLALDRRFKAFTKPVDIEEVPDYCTVVKQPMDLSTVLTKIDVHSYVTVKEFLHDVDLIWKNALEYNPDSNPTDRQIRHRACALKDTVHSIIRDELDEDFEKICQKIRESRNMRGEQNHTHQTGRANMTPCHSRVQSNLQTAVLAVDFVPVEQAPHCTGSDSASTGVAVQMLRSHFVLSTKIKPPWERQHLTFVVHLGCKCVSVCADVLSQLLFAAGKRTRRSSRTAKTPAHGKLPIDADEALKILSQKTPRLIVDHEQLKELHRFVVVKTEGCEVFQLEKLYALLCQCIYRHRKDSNKTGLIQV